MPAPMAFPAIDVPAPRQVTGTPWRRATSIAPMTWSALAGNTTAIGRMR